MSQNLLIKKFGHHFYEFVMMDSDIYFFASDLKNDTHSNEFRNIEAKSYEKNKDFILNKGEKNEIFNEIYQKKKKSTWMTLKTFMKLLNKLNR